MIIAALMIILLIASGVVWLVDVTANHAGRKRLDQKEPEYVSFSRGLFLILAVVSIIKFTDFGILPLLVVLTFASLIIWLVDKYSFKAARVAAKKKEPLLVDYARSLFPIFAIVLIIRCFLFQPFRVPTGSLEPTVMPNDFLFVTQYSYGLRLPITHTKILKIGEPKIGDIAVFRYPVQPNKYDFVKRIVGTPGDHVVYKNKVLYINGVEAKQTFIKNGFDEEPGVNIPSKIMLENLAGVKHEILIHDVGGQTADFDFVVPNGYYFAMGDNRDNSADSRVWGYVPEGNFIGKARRVFFAWNKGVTWSRIGNKL